MNAGQLPALIVGRRNIDFKRIGIENNAVIVVRRPQRT